MAATSYSTLPPTTHVSLGSQGEVNRSTNYGKNQYWIFLFSFLLIWIFQGLMIQVLDL